MIFNVPMHIAMIQNGLFHDRLRSRYPDMIVKTQTRRLKRGIYKVGKDYAVQRKRGVKAEPDIRIVMDRIWEDFDYISKEDALAEGGYNPAQFEELFAKINSKWKGGSRWAFAFHVVEVYTKEEKEIYRKFDGAQKELDKEGQQQKLERSLKHLHQEIIEHIHPYVITKIEKVQR